jgi:hypothetical protein
MIAERENGDNATFIVDEPAALWRAGGVYGEPGA